MLNSLFSELTHQNNLWPYTQGLMLRCQIVDSNLIIGRFIIFITRVEILAAVNIQVEVFRVVMPCGIVTEYQRFECPCCLHLSETASQPRKPRLALLSFLFFFSFLNNYKISWTSIMGELNTYIPDILFCAMITVGYKAFINRLIYRSGNMMWRSFTYNFNSPCTLYGEGTVNLKINWSPVCNE